MPRNRAQEGRKPVELLCSLVDTFVIETDSRTRLWQARHDEAVVLSVVNISSNHSYGCRLKLFRP